MRRARNGVETLFESLSLSLQDSVVSVNTRFGSAPVVLCGAYGLGLQRNA